METAALNKIHEVTPREQIGSRTGNLYEYQYHQAAVGALSLLDEVDAVCVYCEWHDDYVIEGAKTGHYSFHQVKTRTPSQGVWKWTKFFGLAKKNKDGTRSLSTSDESSIFSNLWDHTQKFGDQCFKFVFVSDSEIEEEFRILLKDVELAATRIELKPGSSTIFQTILGAIVTNPGLFPNATEDNLFAFLKKLCFTKALGSVGNLDDIKVLIASRISDASEVDIKLSDANKIGDDLVSKVRKRSHTTLQSLPTSLDELRVSKGIVIGDLLQILSLSEPGCYLLLKTEASSSVKTLSRLQRLCAKNGVPDEFVPDLCEFKINWTAWWTAQRAFINNADFVALKLECANILRAHSQGNLGFDVMANEAKGLAMKYGPIFASTEIITAEHIIGLIILLAVEAEA